MSEAHKRQLDREAALAEKLICKACDGAGRKIVGQQPNGLPIGKRCVACRGSGLALHYVPADRDGAADLLNLIDELAAEVKNGQAMGLGDISIANRIRATYTQEIVTVGLAGIPDVPLSEAQIQRVERARKQAGKSPAAVADEVLRDLPSFSPNTYGTRLIDRDEARAAVRVALVPGHSPGHPETPTADRPHE